MTTYNNETYEKRRLARLSIVLMLAFTVFLGVYFYDEISASFEKKITFASLVRWDRSPNEWCHGMVDRYLGGGYYEIKGTSCHKSSKTENTVLDEDTQFILGSKLQPVWWQSLSPSGETYTQITGNGDLPTWINDSQSGLASPAYGTLFFKKFIKVKGQWTELNSDFSRMVQ